MASVIQSARLEVFDEGSKSNVVHSIGSWTKLRKVIAPIFHWFASHFSTKVWCFLPSTFEPYTTHLKFLPKQCLLKGSSAYSKVPLWVFLLGFHHVWGKMVQLESASVRTKQCTKCCEMSWNPRLQCNTRAVYTVNICKPLAAVFPHCFLQTNHQIQVWHI